jgi:hypothetical protein
VGAGCCSGSPDRNRKKERKGKRNIEKGEEIKSAKIFYRRVLKIVKG